METTSLRTSRSEFLWPTVILTVVMVLGVYFRWGGESAILLIESIIAAGFTVYLLIRQTKWLYALLWVALPFSQQLGLGGDSITVSMPTELLALVFSMYMGYWCLSRPKAIARISHPITFLAALDVAWLLVASVDSTDSLVSLKRVAMRTNFYLFALVLPFVLFKSKKWLLKPFFFMALGLVPVIFIIFLQHAQYDFIPQASFVVSRPYYDDHTIYGAAIVIVLPITFLLWQKARGLLGPHWKYKTMLGIVLLVLLAGFVMTFSRAAWLSLLVGIAFAFALKWRLKPWVFGLIILGSGALVFALSSTIMNKLKETEAVSNDGDIANQLISVTNVSTDASNLERINRWVCAWRMFKDKPLTGFGPGTYQFEYAQFQTREYTTYISTRDGDRGNAHSEYLTYLAETGLPGFLLFLVLVSYSLLLAIRNNLRAKGMIRYINNAVAVGLVTFYFHGIFNAFIDQDKMALPVFCCLAAIAAIDKYHIPNTGDEKAPA